MTEFPTISRDRYKEEIREQASYLADAIRDSGRDHPSDENAAIDLVGDVLDGHGWIEYAGPAVHGQVIQHASESNVGADHDPTDIIDLDAYVEGKDVEAITKTLAYISLREDVVDRSAAYL